MTSLVVPQGDDLTACVAYDGKEELEIDTRHNDACRTGDKEDDASSPAASPAASPAPSSPPTAGAASAATKAPDWIVRRLPLALLLGDGKSRFEFSCKQMTCMTEPVGLAVVLTIVYVRCLGLGIHGAEPFATPMPYTFNASDSMLDHFVGTVINSMMLMGCIIVTTLIFVTLFKYRCAKIIYGILVASYGLVLGSWGGFLLYEFVRAQQVPLDYITFSVIVLNFSVGGLVIIFWKYAHDLEALAFKLTFRGYVLLVCIGLTWPFCSFDEWTVWLTLILLVIWDLFAVLTPCGPLRYVMELEHTRRLNGEVFDIPPGLVYEGGLFRLGTGDLLFYGVLVGRAASAGLVTTFTCAAAIMAGMGLTIHATVRSSTNVLPALPIAITLGLFVYFVVRYLVDPAVTATFAVSGVAWV